MEEPDTLDVVPLLPKSKAPVRTEQLFLDGVQVLKLRPSPTCPRPRLLLEYGQVELEGSEGVLEEHGRPL